MPIANIAKVPYYYKLLSKAIGVRKPTIVAKNIRQLLAILTGLPFNISGIYSQITGH